MQGSWDTAGEMTPNVPMEPNGLHGRQLELSASASVVHSGAIFASIVLNSNLRSSPGRHSVAGCRVGLLHRFWPAL